MGWLVARTGWSTSMCEDMAELEDWKETVKWTAGRKLLPSRQMSNENKGSTGRMDLLCSRNSKQVRDSQGERCYQRENGLTSRNSQVE